MKLNFFPYLLFSLFILFTNPSAAQTGWHELGSPILNSYSDKPVYAMTKNQSGSIIYATIGNNVYKWEGNGWLALGTGSNALNADSYIFSITTDPAGNVYAAGWFSNAFGKPYVAKWDGTSWSELGTGTNSLNASGPIYSITSDAAGNIYAAGSIRSTTGFIYVAKWNGTTWTELGTGANALNADGKINVVTTDAAGNIYAAVCTTVNTNSYVAKWNGSAWSVLGSMTNGLYRDIITMIIDATGSVLVAGRLQNANGKYYVAKWSGTSWQELGTGVNGINANLDILSLTKDNTGNIYAAGVFYNNTAFKCYVSKWNGTNWTEMGVGANSLNANRQIYALVTDASGKVYAGGDFSNSLGYKYVSNWDQNTASWVETGLGGIGTLNSAGEPIVATKNADTVFATFNPYINGSGGNGFQVMMWNGNIWKNFGNLNGNLGISTMARDGLGSLYAAGSFSLVNHPGVAKSNGGAWQDVGNSANILSASEITKIIVDSTGNVYATGYFRNSNGKYYVAKWNGTSWIELGTGANSLNSEEVIPSMAVDKAGNVYVCAYKFFEYGIYKWNGTTWGLVAASPFDTPLDAVQSIAVDDNGVVYSTMTDWPGNYVRKWTGSSWVKMGGFGTGAIQVVAGYKNNIFIVCYDDNKVKRFNGSGWSVVGPATAGELVPGQSLYSDALGNLYCRAKHTGTTNYYVAKYDAALLDAPVIVNVSDKCSDIPTTKGKLWNPPVGGTVSITQDGLPLTYNAADSSFQYFTNGVTPSGNHTVVVKYTIGANVLVDSALYKVTTVIVPAVSISTPDTVVCANTAFVVKCAVNVPGVTYQWYLDSWPCINNCNDSVITLGLNNAVPTLNVYCKVTFPASGCFSAYTVNSNSLFIKQGIVTPTVSISSNDLDNIICDKQPVTFTATPAKAGNTPSYSWQVNGINVGTNSNTYSGNLLKNGDQVKVVLTSSAGCAGQPTAISNIITMSTWPTNFQQPDSLKSLCSGFNLSIPIGVATAPGYSYNWSSVPVGFVSTIANPLVSPNVSTKYTLLQTHTASGCNNSSVVNVQADTGCAARGIVITPNPANDHLLIQLNVNDTEPKYFTLINSSGVLVLQKPLGFSTAIDTRTIPSGIYFYRITVGFGTLMKSGKLIIQH
jgi:Secretion system C-terminal sorting domain